MSARDDSGPEAEHSSGDRGPAASPGDAAGPNATVASGGVADDTGVFTNLSTDFYRAEMERMSTWRTRLDQTTNWAVVVLAAILTWAFSSADNPHYVLLVGFLATCVFLFIEAGRYREYDAWRARNRVLQRNLFAHAFDSGRPEEGDWREWLGGHLRDPRLELSMAWALGHRLQHIYLPLLSVLLAAWGLRITVFETGETWRQTASIATMPGEFVVGGVVVVYLGLVGLTAWAMHRDVRREFHEERPYRDDAPPE